MSGWPLPFGILAVALLYSAVGHAGACGDILKAPRPEVAKETTRLRLAHDEDIRTTVAVEVPHRDTRADGADCELLIPLPPHRGIGEAVLRHEAAGNRVDPGEERGSRRPRACREGFTGGAVGGGGPQSGGDREENDPKLATEADAAERSAHGGEGGHGNRADPDPPAAPSAILQRMRVQGCSAEVKRVG